MTRINCIWHSVAQLVVLGSVWACSGEALEQSSDTQNSNDSAADDLRNTADTERGDSNEVAHALEFRMTAVRVVNRSSEVRSRYASCTGPSYTIGVRPAGTDLPSLSPTCTKSDCAAVPAGETLRPDTECSVLTCAPQRIDLAPGAADVDFNWDGIYLTLTQRNCYEPTAFEPGTPMLAHICFGRPAAGDYDIQDYNCSDYSFAYGVPVLDVELP